MWRSRAADTLFTMTRLGNSRSSPASRQARSRAARKPSRTPKATALSAASSTPRSAQLLSLIVETPSTRERIDQGGSIGYLTIVLGVGAFIWGIFRWVTLSSTVSAVKAQSRKGKASKSNPLGRVMMAYEAVGNKNDTEAVAAALDDAILKEVPKLESGLNLIKIISNVAPLLGLLGTVVGMVITFQSITLVRHRRPADHGVRYLDRADDDGYRSRHLDPARASAFLRGGRRQHRRPDPRRTGCGHHRRAR